jgi:hypothetical protein
MQLRRGIQCVLVPSNLTNEQVRALSACQSNFFEFVQQVILQTREMSTEILHMYGICDPGVRVVRIPTQRRDEITGDKIVMMHGKGETQGTFGAGMMVYLMRLR